MNGIDCVRRAFTQVRERSDLVAVEILWKWAWAASVVAVAAGSALLLLDSVTLSPAELRSLRSRLPWLIVLTLRRLWERHKTGFVETTTIVLLSAAVLWWLAASLFRSGIAGGLLEETGVARPLENFAQGWRRSLPAYLNSHLWSAGIAVVTLWLSARILLGSTVYAVPEVEDRTAVFLEAVVTVAALLFFWQLLAWVLGLGRAVASRCGWGFVRSLGFALHLLGARPADVLFTATTMFLLRAMALALSGTLGTGLIYAAVALDRRLSFAGLMAALILISVPARWLFVVQQAAFLELTRGATARN